MAADGVVALYEQSLAKRGFVSDPAQWRAVERLQRLYEEWSAYKARRNDALKRLLVKPPLPKGVYLWGPVGRGKSFLMDASTSACRWCASAACTSTTSCARSIASSSS